LEKG
jgi:mevalonate kinase